MSSCPGGSADWLLVRADGVLELDFRATLRTDDGALIAMRSFGLRHGPPDVIAALGRGERVDPDQVLLSNHGPLRNRTSGVRVSQSAGGRSQWRSTP